MSNNIIIRTAKQDYVCDCCGHKISKGTEYLDKVILNNGKCVQHNRYHDECSRENYLLSLIFNNTDKVPVTNNYTKHWLVGVEFINGKRHAKLNEWDNEEKVFFIDEETFNKDWR